MSTIPQDNGNGPKKNDILFHPTNPYVAMRYIDTEQFENKRYIRYYSKSKNSSVPDKAHIYYHCCQTDGSGKVCGEPDPRIEASDSKTKICEKVRHDCLYVFPLVNNGQRRILLEDVQEALLLFLCHSHIAFYDASAICFYQFLYLLMFYQLQN
ncbi:MAG: hypothetical protein EZS28_051791 [Streblomastix strix]|uniref:Uncharacterized protein n=1 Tax=Streblomastix strix TaxID=222440 RepID=A0A5J4T3Z7_9EUKA|nr:MAG: hypothetical protein EZS28_051791 [Streblomastix strix]